MSLRILLASVLMFGFAAPVAFAQAPAPQAGSEQRQAGVRARQAAQMKRIQAGRQSGAITQAEARRLLAMEARIRTAARRAHASGGELTRAERLRLQASLNRASRAIHRAARNGRGGGR